MSNATFHKYNNLFAVNRKFNPTFDNWIESNYHVNVGYDPWNWGRETYVHKVTGESVYTSADIMQRYVKTKLPYFRSFDEMDNY